MAKPSRLFELVEFWRLALISAVELFFSLLKRKTSRLKRKTSIILEEDEEEEEVKRMVELAEMPGNGWK